MQDRLQQSQQENTLARGKIAQGILAIRNCHKFNTTATDIQGIKTFKLSHLELAKIADKKFINLDIPGITVHIYQPGYIKHPPLLNIIEQKIQSMSQACKADGDEIFARVQKKLKLEFERLKLGLAALETEAEKIAYFNKKSEKLIQLAIEIATHELYDRNESERTYKVFRKKLIDKTKHIRADGGGILIFNAEQNTFSYTEPFSTVTAHDRHLYNSPANAAYTFDGTYTNETCEVKSAIVKHASLVPIDMLPDSRLTDLYLEDDVDLIVAVCNQMEETARAMARLRKHGQTEEAKIKIDWIYQLLTSNAFNVDKQSESYGYMLKAATLMQHVDLMFENDKKFHLNLNIFNAGINALGNWNAYQHKDLLIAANRAAYLEVNHSVITHTANLIEKPTKYETILNLLKIECAYMHSAKALTHKKQAEKRLTLINETFHQKRRAFLVVIEEYKTYREKIKRDEKDPDIPTKMNELSQQYLILKQEMGDLIDEAEDLRIYLAKINKKIEERDRDNWQSYQKRIQFLFNQFEDTDELEDLLTDLASTDLVKKKKAEAALISLTALRYKSYLDELYYTGQYREPKNAALFHAYLASYQYLTGMMGSIGCKSGNDRTYVMRLLIATLNNRDKKLLPLPLHEDEKVYDNFCAELSESQAAHSAIHDCIADSGGTPKVDGKKFKFLQSVLFLKYLSRFGKFAAHKIKNLTTKMLASYQKFENQHHAEENVIELPQSLEEARGQLKTAEEKVGDGIASILQSVLDQEADIDIQGIKTVKLSAEEVRKLAPEKFLANKEGITVHIYAPGYIKHPPLLNMIEQKIKVLCKAAKKADAFEAISKYVEEKLAQLNIDLSASLEGDEIRKTEIFSQYANEMMQVAIEATFEKLHEGRTDNVSAFRQRIIEKAKKIRADQTAILTYDVAQETFSYTEPFSEFPAYSRQLLNKPSNAAYTFDGIYAENKCQRISSIIKHASLAPIQKIASWRFADRKEENIDLIVSVCNQIEEIAQAMANLREHGGDKDKMNINWVYQLLTSNALNIDKQASTYGYIIKAAHLMNHTELKTAKNTPFNLTMHVFNAGINTLGQWNAGQHSDLFAAENRAAYLEVNRSLNVHTKKMLGNSPFVTSLNNLKAKYATLHSAKAYAKKTPILKEIEQVNQKFMQVRGEFNASVRAVMENHNSGLKELYYKKKKEMSVLLTQSEKLNCKMAKINLKIEKQERKRWARHRGKVTVLIQELQQLKHTYSLMLQSESSDKKEREMAEDALVSLTALIYKSYLDELYYSGNYRTPKHAALFHAYLASYQQLTGMMASVSCKSGNNRTYVARLIIATLKNKQDKLAPLPEALHRDQQAYDQLCDDLSHVQASHSGVHDCIADTGGAPPKVDSTSYKFLKAVRNIDYLSRFVKFAAHHLENIMANIAMTYQNFGASQTSRTDRLFSNPDEVVEPRDAIKDTPNFLHKSN